jgi:hypothetical protein
LFFLFFFGFNRKGTARVDCGLVFISPRHFPLALPCSGITNDPRLLIRYHG